MDTDGHGWTRMDTDGHGWTRMDTDEHGLLPFARDTPTSPTKRSASIRVNPRPSALSLLLIETNLDGGKSRFSSRSLRSLARMTDREGFRENDKHVSV